MNRPRRLLTPLTLAAGISLVGCGGTQTTDMSGYNTPTGSRYGDNSMVSSATSYGASTLGTKFLPLSGGRYAFVAGITLPAVTGQTSTEFEKKPAYASKTVGTSMQDISSLGANVIRVNLFHSLYGLKFDNSGIVTGMDETFLKDLSDLLDKAEANKMQVYITVLDQWIDAPNAKSPLLSIPARDAFFKKVIAPLAANLKGRTSVFAVDAYSEIENQVAGKEGNGSDKGLTWDQARNFLKSEIEAIKAVDPQRMVTASSGLHGWENVKDGKFSKLGLDFYDIHVFDDKGALPAAKDLKTDRTILVGACGPSVKNTDPDTQSKADEAFMDSAYRQGYAGLLLSEYDRNPKSALSLLDKDGKHKPALSQFQTFVASLQNSASAPKVGK